MLQGMKSTSLQIDIQMFQYCLAKIFLSPLNCLYTSVKKSDGHKHVILFLDSLFCCNDLFVYIYANIPRLD